MKNRFHVMVKHLAGSLRSRWTDFLTTDGNKPDRDKDGEFVMEETDDRGALMDAWEKAWGIALAALRGLTPADLQKTVLMRGATESVMQAILHQLTHVANHVGQVVFLAKHYAGGKWETLSFPRNKARVTSRRMSPPRRT